MTIPFTDGAVEAALQVLIVPRTSEELTAIGGDVDVTTHMKLTYVFLYDDNTQSNEDVYSTGLGLTSSCKTIKTDGTTYEKYVPVYGGFVPVMAGVSCYVNGFNSQIVSSPGYFWANNKYYAPQEEI